MTARLAALLLATSLAGPGAAPEPVGPDAVWSPPVNFLATMHEACDSKKGDAFGQCFVDRMRRAGASDAAVAFARRTGNLGYLREFRATGVVDVACAEFPFRANENSVCFLVNGQPPMIDVDDQAFVDRAPLTESRVWVGLARKYPNLAIFPGRRFGDLAVRERDFRTGLQRFEADYILVDGCRACPRVGTMRLAFDFDVEGRYVGMRVIAVHALNR